MSCFSRTACAVALSFAFQPAFAADEEAAVIVTATRMPILLEHATGEVAVVSRKEIEGRNTQRLNDLVGHLPGVYNAPGKGFLQPTTNLALRGIPDDRRTLVMVDGISVSDSYTGSVNLAGIPTGIVSQAEVLYGPMSSMFGGSAVGGVINFVTRMPTAPEFSVRVGYGDAFEAGAAPAALKKALVQAGTRLDNGLALRVTASHASTDGYRGDWVTASANPAGTNGAVPTVSEKGAAAYLLGKRGENHWRENGASFKLEQILSGGTRWDLGWQQQEYEYGFGTPESYLRTAGGAATYGPAATALSFAGNDGGYRRQLLHAGLETAWGIGQLHLKASFTETGRNFMITPTSGATGGTGRITESPAETLNLDAYWTAVLDDHGFTAGWAYRHDHADSETHNLTNWADPASKTTLYSAASGQTVLLAVYLQDEWRLTPDVTLQAGMRYDHWRNSDGSSLITSPTVSTSYPARTEQALSPKLGVSYRPFENLTLRASAGSAFRAPTIYDLYRTAKFSSYTIVANPMLKPETVKTWDLGGEWRPWQNGELRLGYFDNQMKDLIYVQGSGTTRTRINAGAGESHGFTLALSHRFDADNRLFANLTHTRSEITKNAISPASVGKQLTYLPQRQASFGFDTRHGNLTTSATLRHASKQYSTDDNSDVVDHTYKSYDAYTLADLKFAYRFDRQVSLSLAIDNLFDKQYFSYYAAPGRSWFAELSYQY